ncbi:MAG TPA: hypothetical protein VES60_02645 [Nakamurella sp.]|nr:hypothetical protein [Nakamurella sp.]
MLDRRSVRRALALALLAVLTVGLAGCTGNDSSPDRTTVEKVWTAAGIAPVSEVQAVGGVAVVYGTAGDDLVIYGLDPVTGTQLWSKPAALPTDRSDSIDVREIDGAVAYLRPTGTARLSQLVLADPTTGADLTVSAARYWYTLPARCHDDAWVCLTSYVQQAGGHWDLRRFRVNRATGDTVAVDVDDSATDDYQLPVGDLFYSLSDDGAMQIGRRVDGSVLWTKPSSDIWGPTMPRPWYFTTWDTESHGFAIMTTEGRGTDQPGGARLDLAKDVASASVSLADGAVRWVSPGAAVGCGADPYLLWDVTEDDAADTLAYRCKYTGSAVRNFSALRGLQLTTTDLSVAVEAFDPMTGDVRWTADVGDARALASDSAGQKSALLDDDHVVVANSAGWLVVDLQAGQSRPTTADDVLWCTDESAFPRPEPYFQESTPITTAKRSGVVHPCRPDGSAAPLPTAAIPSKLSASFDGDRRVIALSDGVAGFLVPPAAGGDADADGGAAGSETATSASTEATPDSTADSTPSSAAAGGEPAAPALHAVEQAWAATGFEAKTTPKLVGETAVLYGTVGTQLFLIGLDPATGAERWRHPATAGALSPRQEVEVVTLDDKVAFLRPVPNNDRMAQIALIDPATGADVIVTEMQWWLGFPAVCYDDPATWCATAYYLEPNATTLTSRRFRIDRGTGALTLIPEPAAAPSAPYTVLRNDVVQINGAPTDTLGVVRDGAVVWSRPVTDLAGAGATLDGWWVTEDDGATPMLELSVHTGWSGSSDSGGRYPSLDLATNLVTVGINRNDGAVVWSKPGTWSGCRGKLWFSRTMSTPGSPDPALRCRYTGRLDSNPPNRGYDLTEATDLTVTLERVDLQTGEPIWSVPLGAERSLAVDAFGPTVSLLDDHRLLTGGRVVDLDDGSSRAPAGGETFWCPGRQSFDQTVEWMGTDGSIRRDRRVQGEVVQCDGSGNAASGTPSAVPLAVSAVTDGGLRLVSTPAGVVAYRVPL